MLESLVEAHLGTNGLASSELFAGDYVTQALQGPRGKVYSTERAYRIWSPVLAEIRCRTYLDARGARPLTGAVGRPVGNMPVHS